VSVKVVDNTRRIIGDTTVKANIFLRMMADEVERIARPNTPKDLGDLKNNIVKQVLGLKGKIRWAQVYAAYQERGARKDGSHKVRRYSTPGTGAHFAENAIKEAEKRTAKVAKQAGLT
jgi:hypothetical protein